MGKCLIGRSLIDGCLISQRVSVCSRCSEELQQAGVKGGGVE